MVTELTQLQNSSGNARRLVSKVADHPESFSFTIPWQGNEKLLLRPLEHQDCDRLAKFLENLSPQTRKFYTCDSYDRKFAQELCDAINKYDKIRLVVTEQCQNSIVSLIVFSLDIPEGDLQRYREYGITLTQSDIRFGPCIADAYQNRGLGSLLFQTVIEIARTLEKQRILLFGGVLVENKRAIRFYEKQGFKILGDYIDAEGGNCYDMILEI